MANQSLRSSRKKVLVVEDDLRQLLVSIVALVKCSKVDVDSTDRADTAVMLVRKATFDLVIMDIRLPGFGRTDSGIEAIQRIRDFNKEIPILVISAYPDMYEGAALKAGANKFLPKTLPMEEIVRIIEEYLER